MVTILTLTLRMWVNNISIVSTVSGKGFTGISLSANLEGRKFACFRSNNPRWFRCN